MTEKPQNIKINRGSTSTGPVSAIWRILPPPGRIGSPGPGGGGALSPREDGHTFVIAFRSWYFFQSIRIDRVYASVANQLRRGQQPDHRWSQQGGRHIPQVFPSSSAITPSYNDPGRILTGGPPAARRWDRGVVSLQDWSPSTALLPLQRTSPEAGFRGGVYGDNIIAQQISSYVSSDLNE